MSLLIKALESAEKGKQAELKRGAVETASSVDLGLEPLSIVETAAPAEKQLNLAAEEPHHKAGSFNTASVASTAKLKQQSEIKKDNKQQVAANVFVANQAVKKSTSPTALLMLGAAGALLIWIGLQGYQYITKVNTPDAVVVKADPQAAATAEVATVSESPAQTIEPEASPAQAEVTEVVAMPANAVVQAPKTAVNKYAGISTETALIPESNAAVNSSAAGNVVAANKVTRSRVAESGNVANQNSGELNISELNASERNKREPLKLVSRTPAAGVDPTLLAAYEAYGRGDNAAAQAQYRQVLQADARNVDALLGMAAIALKQSRDADANGWYQKVLEIEPRNSTALSALANSQISTESAGSAAADYVGTESRIKSMLAQQPEAANLHAALGNLYAAQNQWSLAQPAYFNASRYAPNSADYAFNLAVSLDQLGKSGLALAQYQRALGLLKNAGTSSLDKAQLEARIQALQQ
ncbi:MAG TPA: tetratricopeptide repeat protein [Methylotenera sp.]